jgi:hypothetical protein
MATKMKKYNNIEVETVEKLRQLIQDANCVNEMDDLRYACVKFMNNGHPDVLKEWQDKYWSLKRCPTCGRIR